jgi:DNA-binding PadR family transcriptional regulator
MARSNKSRFAVLGILTFGPMSGYDIRKVFGRGPGHFWQESYGQIYPILRALTAEGLVTRRVTQRTGRPARKEYRLTAQGREALKEWLVEPPEPQPARCELLLKLFFGRHAQPGICAEHLRRERESLASRRELYREIEGRLRERCAADPDAPYQLITLRYGLLVTQALLDWCDESQRALGHPRRRASARRMSGRQARARAP